MHSCVTERNGRIKNQQELNDKLVLTNQLLDEDCDQLQEEVSSYEVILDSHTSESATLQEQLLQLYKCLQTGCKKVRLGYRCMNFSIKVSFKNHL